MSEEYIPLSLRRELCPRLISYGIGVENESDSYGMTHGPVPNEQLLLDEIPLYEKSVLIRFNADYSETVLWRWNKDRWVREAQS